MCPPAGTSASSMVVAVFMPDEETRQSSAPAPAQPSTEPSEPGRRRAGRRACLLARQAGLSTLSVPPPCCAALTQPPQLWRLAGRPAGRAERQTNKPAHAGGRAPSSARIFSSHARVVGLPYRPYSYDP